LWKKLPFKRKLILIKKALISAEQKLVERLPKIRQRQWKNVTKRK
jgi:hypothetical protein